MHNKQWTSYGLNDKILECIKLNLWTKYLEAADWLTECINVWSIFHCICLLERISFGLTKSIHMTIANFCIWLNRIFWVAKKFWTRTWYFQHGIIFHSANIHRCFLENSKNDVSALFMIHFELIVCFNFYTCFVAMQVSYSNLVKQFNDFFIFFFKWQETKIVNLQSTCYIQPI